MNNRPPGELSHYSRPCVRASYPTVADNQQEEPRDTQREGSRHRESPTTNNIVQHSTKIPPILYIFK